MKWKFSPRVETPKNEQKRQAEEIMWLNREGWIWGGMNEEKRH